MLKSIKLIAIGFTAAILLFSCNGDQGQNQNGEKEHTQAENQPQTKDPIQVSYESLGWMTGKWRGITEGESDPNSGFFEYWKNDVDGVRTGWSYRVVSGDTTNWKDLRIEYSAKGLFYKEKGREGEALERVYKMSRSTPQFIEFESMDSGFPQSIRYAYGTDGKLMVDIKGSDGEGNSAVLESAYERVE